MDNKMYDNDDEIMSLIIESGALPQYIYKYTSLETAKTILKYNTIRFSKPPLFNDPFDFQLTFDTENTNEEIDKYVNQIAHTKGLSTHQREEYRDKLRSPEKRFSITNNSIQKAINSMKISCFSTVFDNLLMWAHYANKHCGVVLKFDILKDSSFFMVPYSANYVNKYPVFNYIRDDYFKGGGYLSQLLVETKSLDWQYENEIRVMKPDADIHNPAEYQDFSINREAIIGVAFGCQVKDEYKKEFIQYAKGNGWNHLMFKEAKKKLWEFGLEFTTF